MSSRVLVAPKHEQMGVPLWEFPIGNRFRIDSSNHLFLGISLRDSKSQGMLATGGNRFICNNLGCIESCNLRTKK